jgi:predicted amino acid racemase
MHARTPFITVALGAVRHNAKLASSLCPKGSRVWFVSKVAAGDVKIAGALLGSGCFGLADSRLENLAKIKNAFPECKTMLIRPAGLERCDETVRLADVSLESAIENVRRLGMSAGSMGKTHKVIAMIELGDLREGVMERDAKGFIKEILSTPNIALDGIGAVLTCFAGVVPDPSHMDRIMSIAGSISQELDISFDWISAGATNTLPLALSGTLPKEINDHRIGEGIMLGTDVTDRGILKGFRPDAFILTGEVIEVYDKPTVPTGRISQNVSGHVQHFEDRGIRRRAIVNFGMADAESSLLKPLAEGIEILGSTSDHTVLDVQDARIEVSVGTKLDFLPGYGALVRIMNSNYIEKNHKED